MTGTRCFLDTNIFLYGLDQTDSRKLKVAFELVDHVLIEQNGVISYQVVQEFVSVALRKFPAVMSPDELQRYLDKVFCRFEVIESSADLFTRALSIHTRHKLSWYDSLIVAAALEAKCEVLYTEDLQHGQRFGDLTVTNPFL